ncbi:hypothetical protein CPL0016902_CDS0027 [Escherichia phage tunus]|nr:hypothetical protein [Escherichia phage vB-Eco-KMB46]
MTHKLMINMCYFSCSPVLSDTPDYIHTHE